MGDIGLFDLVNDVFKLICLEIPFFDQLHLRQTCKQMHHKIYYSEFKGFPPYGPVHWLLRKISHIIENCHSLILYTSDVINKNTGRHYLPVQYEHGIDRFSFDHKKWYSDYHEKL